MSATTIRYLAREAGISVGTTNCRFGSKNDVVQELHLEVQGLLRSVLPFASLPLVRGPVRQLVELIAAARP